MSTLSPPLFIYPVHWSCVCVLLFCHVLQALGARQTLSFLVEWRWLCVWSGDGCVCVASDLAKEPVTKEHCCWAVSEGPKMCVLP